MEDVRIVGFTAAAFKCHRADVQPIVRAKINFGKKKQKTNTQLCKMEFFVKESEFGSLAVAQILMCK